MSSPEPTSRLESLTASRPPSPSIDNNHNHNHTTNPPQDLEKALPPLRSPHIPTGHAVTVFFRALFQVSLGISTLGLSITFNFVISDVKKPSGDMFWWRQTTGSPSNQTLNNSLHPNPNPHTSIPNNKTTRAHLTFLLSLAFLLFLLGLTSSAILSTLLNFFARDVVAVWDGERRVDGRPTRQQRVLQAYATGACLWLYGLVAGALVLMGLVVAAYSLVVGWVVVGVIGVTGVLGMVGVVAYSPLAR